VRLGIAAQLAYSMGLHSDAKTATLGLDPIEVQLRRRTFWHLYAMDKWVRGGRIVVLWLGVLTLAAALTPCA
jgi:hypothetical protein